MERLLSENETSFAEEQGNPAKETADEKQKASSSVSLITYKEVDVPCVLMTVGPNDCLSISA